MIKTTWPLKKLGELAIIQTGATPPTAEGDFFGGDIPFITPGDLTDFSTISTWRTALTAEGAARARMLPAHSILVCCIGATIGKIGYALRTVTANQQINALVFHEDKVFPRFGFYACTLLKPTLLGMSGSTTLPIVSKSKFQQLSIPVPPLPEQRRIAAILDKADAIRRKREEGIRLTEELLRSTFLEMFGDPATATAKPLAELAEVVSGVTKGRKLNGRAVTVPYLRVANVQDGFLNLDEIKTIEALPEEVESLTLKPGDIVMTEGGDYDKLGRGAIWTGSVQNCIHQNHVFRVRVNREHILPDYFAAFLRSSEAKRYFLRCAKKTTNLASINMTQLRGLPVPVPAIRLQEKFQDAAKAIKRISAMRTKAVCEAQLLFGSLVQRAFRGEL